MIPGVYEFAWDAGHLIFLGVFYGVVALVISTVIIASLRSVRAARQGKGELARWHTDFEDLPAAARRCRHELTGELGARECPNGFDCRQCEVHGRLVAAAARVSDGEAAAVVAGLLLDPARLYHRGHTWVRPEEDGTVTIGLDELALRLVDGAERELPPVGQRLVVNGPAWQLRRQGTEVRVLSPVDGEVVATGGTGVDWVLKIRPATGDTRHLLSPVEAKSWMLRELERLQLSLGGEGVGASLADGGVLVDDLASAIGPDRYDDVCGLMFLAP